MAGLHYLEIAMRKAITYCTFGYCRQRNHHEAMSFAFITKGGRCNKSVAV